MGCLTRLPSPAMRAMTTIGTRHRETVEAARHRLDTVLPAAGRQPPPSQAPDPPGHPPLLHNRLGGTAAPPPPPPTIPECLQPTPAGAAPESILERTRPQPERELLTAPVLTPTQRLRSGLHSASDLDRRAVVGLLILLLLTIGYSVQHFWLGRPHEITVPVATIASAPPADPVADPVGRRAASRAGASPRLSPGPATRLVVDVSGKVKHPGLQTLPRGSRVADALLAAGGPARGADTSGLNLARFITDGEQILVGSPVTRPAAASGAPAAGPVSLNTATIEQLDALPGVGPVLAQHIVEYRDAHAGFTAVEQLKQVTGIGDRKYADLSPLVTL